MTDNSRKISIFAISYIIPNKNGRSLLNISTKWFKQNAAQRARYEQQETWETRLAELKESCEEQRHKMEQSMDDRAIVRTIGHQMADNLDQTTKIIQQRIEQLSATEEMVNRNQTEILKLQQVQQDILRHFTQLIAYETGGK